MTVDRVMEIGRTVSGEMWTTHGIGITAGHVWNFLRQHDKASLTALKRGIKSPEPMVLMAIGWLAREGKVDFRREGRTVQLWLMKS